MNPSTQHLIPQQHPEKVWALQNALLAIAETELGSRGTAHQIARPTFVDDGPRLRFNADRSIVWAELSRHAAGYWPTLVYELAHETIHLLDPVVGYTNMLEEGIAVEFQLWIAPILSGVNIDLTLATYLDARAKVGSLGMPHLEAGRLVRSTFGSLGGVSPNDLQSVFTAADRELIEKLAATCVPR